MTEANHPTEQVNESELPQPQGDKAMAPTRPPRLRAQTGKAGNGMAAPGPLPPALPTISPGRRKGWIRRHPFLTALLAYVLLALCFGHSEEGYTFHIGERIRQGGELRTGVDVNHPVGDTYYVYRRPDGAGTCYVKAPEVSYRPHTSLVAIDDIDYAVDESRYVIGRWLGIPYHAQTAARDIQPTGRILPANVGLITTIQVDAQGAARRHDELVFHEQVHALPSPVEEHLLAGARASCNADSLGTLAVTEKPSDWRRVAAAPFDYVISPILNFTCTCLDSIISLMIT